MLAQFPAAALMFRRGDIKQGNPVVTENRTLKQLWARVRPVIAEDPGYDPNRDLGDAARRSNLKAGVDPLAFLVGPVLVAYGAKQPSVKLKDLKPFIDHRNKRVKSDTGQLVWDYGHGVCTLNAPSARAQPAFLRGSIRSSSPT